MDEFGNRLKECLSKAGYTQSKATEKLNLSKNAILNYTKGRIPEAKILLELSKICNVSMEYLLTGKEYYDELTNEELNILEKYNILTERNKGKVETYIDERIAEQESYYTNDIKDLA